MTVKRSRRGLLIAVFLLLGLTVAGITAGLLVAGSGGGWVFGTRPVLYVRLDGTIPELAPRDGLAGLLGRTPLSMRDLLDGLEKARDDDTIEGVLLDIRSPVLGWAQAEELRRAIEAVERSGKWTTAYFETAGELGSGNIAYWLACSAQRIVLAPPGGVGLTGLRVETPFVRELLDRLGIEPEFGQRKEYKNAVDIFTRRDYTKPHREATGRLLDSLFDLLVQGIAEGRGLTPERVRALIDDGPFLAQEALDAGLVDSLAYWDELLDDLERRTGTDEPLRPLRRYVRAGRPHESGSHRIAIVYAVGQIARGESRRLPTGADVMGSDTITRALRKAREDDDIEAVVLRVDSPGGSYVASDLIRREVELTRKKKPVVVSMGNLAASGGYFISMDGDWIVAEAGTLTGSIGVYSGKFVTRRFWRDKLGINFSGLQRGENADFLSSQEPFDERGRRRLEAVLDRIYDDFVTKAAEGRGLTVEELEPLAHGRVWSGSDAEERHLVDEIGDLERAIEVARERAGIPPGASLRYEILPRPKSFLESLVERRESLVDLPSSARAVAAALFELADPTERWLLDPALPRIR